MYTPQDLAHKLVGLDYGNGTAYAGLQMLEGAVPREAITTCAASANAAERFAALQRGEFEATVLQEPYITVAAKAGCRLVSTTFFYGTWVGDPNLDPEAQAAFLRAITRAVDRVNQDKRQYFRYFLQDWAGRPEVDALVCEDFDLGRIQLKRPGPIPERDARRAWDWMVSWGVLEGSFDPARQLDNRVAAQVAARVL
ncbi:MAG: hypothetical protein JOZ87_30990 [Chloroflexi bacterium]|nr:hypothetical protein [Chloroflexota bacterium]